MKNYRILIVDDTESIHSVIKEILEKGNSEDNISKSSLKMNEIFSKIQINTEITTTKKEKKHINEIFYQITSVFQGNEALLELTRAKNSENNYALAFVDARMPPGMDGIQTIRQLWKIDPDLEVILCTAHSDYSWNDIQEQLGDNSNLLFLKKPFDSIALRQSAKSLCTKWKLKRKVARQKIQLEEKVQERTRDLQLFVQHLSEDFEKPLQILADGAARLQKENGNKLNDNLDWLLQSIDRMKTMSHQLVQYSRSTLPEPRLFKTLLLRLLKESLQDVSLLSNSKKAKIELPDLEVETLTSPAMLRRVFQNILLNSLTYHQVDQNPKIKIFIYQHTKYLEIIFEDEGPGIAEACLERILDLFKPMNCCHKDGMSGIGLALSNRLVRALGGRLMLENIDPHGIRVKVHLPQTIEG